MYTLSPVARHFAHCSIRRFRVAGLLSLAFSEARQMSMALCNVSSFSLSMRSSASSSLVPSTILSLRRLFIQDSQKSQICYFLHCTQKSVKGFTRVLNSCVKFPPVHDDVALSSEVRLHRIQDLFQSRVDRESKRSGPFVVQQEREDSFLLREGQGRDIHEFHVSSELVPPCVKFSQISRRRQVKGECGAGGELHLLW